jgi:hypothetical protein
LHRWLTVISLVILIGGHWAIVQTAAWAGMLVSYSQESTLSDAFAKTFDGQNPCNLCKLVRAGKGAEKEQNALKIEAKQLEFTHREPGCTLFPPQSRLPSFAFLLDASVRNCPPDLPPPIIA